MVRTSRAQESQEVEGERQQETPDLTAMCTSINNGLRADGIWLS